jgi:hypothetical protein
MVTQKVTAEVAVASTMGFLWYWHLTFACIFGAIVGIVFLIGCGAIVVGDSKTKGMGIAGAFVGAPLLLLLVAIGSTLFLGGVYCFEDSIARDPATGEVLPFAAWNGQLMVVGCILYGLGALRQISAKFSSNSSSSN